MQGVNYRDRIILVVDDEPSILESLKDILEANLDKVRVITAASGPAAMDAMDRQPVDVILSDHRMPGMSGLEFLRRAREQAPTVPRILMTAYPDLELALLAIRDAQIDNFLTKPFEPSQLLEYMAAILFELRSEELRSRSVVRSIEKIRTQTGV